MIIQDHAKLVQFVKGPDFTKNNPNCLTERNLVIDNVLVYEHHASKLPVVRFKSQQPPHQVGRMEAEKATYWYRAMTRDEFRYLKKNGALNIDYTDVDVEQEDNRYIGIATNST